VGVGYLLLMLNAAELIAQGRAAAPMTIAPTAFLRLHDVASEVDYKRLCRDSGRVMYHMHVGLSTWADTEVALQTVHRMLADKGHSVDRFGLALDRAMGTPSANRHLVGKETGPRLARDDWARLGEAAAIQPHLGDYMIGLPAGFENTLQALAAGVTTIGNVGQFSAYDIVGGSDEIDLTEQTVRALAAIAALRSQGALAHSNLEDGSATQATHFGAYVGWAALELYVVEELIGARLAHCFGNTIQRGADRAVVHFALDDLRNRDSIGSMIYGNTVDQRAGQRSHNLNVVTEQLMGDIALQLYRPTGHAINPVPLTEAERIPSATEIVEVHLLAREIEQDLRRSAATLDWARLEALGHLTARYAVEFRDAALVCFDADGVDTRDAAQVLLAMRRISMAELEAQINLVPSSELSRLTPWKSRHVTQLASNLIADAPRLTGVRVVLAVLEVHDLIRDALARALPAAGAEVILLGSDSSLQAVAQAAADEDAVAIVLGVYNGNALQLGSDLIQCISSVRWEGRIFMGGILNQDTGAALPIDAKPGLAELGITCVDRVEDLFALLTPSS
jgi:methylmalonyl-CoA mutase cobalamin-binding subunit